MTDADVRAFLDVVVDDGDLLSSITHKQLIPFPLSDPTTQLSTNFSRTIATPQHLLQPCSAAQNDPTSQKTPPSSPLHPLLEETIVVHLFLTHIKLKLSNHDYKQTLHHQDQDQDLIYLPLLASVLCQQHLSLRAQLQDIPPLLVDRLIHMELEAEEVDHINLVGQLLPKVDL